jgi:hypothetical protein
MKKINISLFIAALIGLTSCLKDNLVNLGPGAPASPPVVEWATAQLDDAPVTGATALYRTYTRVYPIAASVNMALQVDLTGSEAAPSDITVTLGTNAAAYTAVVTTAAAQAATPQLPSAAYSIPASVVIAKGTRFANVNITLNTTLLDPTKTYYIPVAITATTYGNVSGNYGTVLYTITPPNKFDGLYTYNNAATASVLPGTTVPNSSLISTGANSVTTTFLQSPSYASTIVYTFSSTLNASGFYPIIGISIPNYFLVSTIDATSGYNPATKVIKAKFTAGTYNFDETYTYTGARTSTR